MMYEYYYSLTPRVFFNTLNGRRKQEDSASKERWVLARKVAYYAVVAHMEDPTNELSFMPFPWETNMIAQMSDAEKAKRLQDLETSRAFWEEQDRKELEREKELAAM